MAKKEDVRETPAIWFQASACSGCAVALLNGAAPTVKSLLIDRIVPGQHVSLKFHPVVMAGSGEAALKVLDAAEQAQDGYLLVVDGALPTASDWYGFVGHKPDGSPFGMAERVIGLARNAVAVVGLGTCAAFGGMHAAHPNPTGCKSVAEMLAMAGVKTPVVNVPGCPPHPDWFTGTVVDVLLHGLPGPEAVDAVGRPVRFFGDLIHDLCERRSDFEAHKFAKAIGEPGCLYNLGCKGPFTHADCPERQFNSGTSWCVKAGGPCQGCTEPTFPDVSCPLYRKIALEAQPRLVRDASGALVAVTKPAPGQGE